VIPRYVKVLDTFREGVAAIARGHYTSRRRLEAPEFGVERSHCITALRQEPTLTRSRTGLASTQERVYLFNIRQGIEAELDKVKCLTGLAIARTLHPPGDNGSLRSPLSREHLFVSPIYAAQCGVFRRLRDAVAAELLQEIDHAGDARTRSAVAGELDARAGEAERGDALVCVREPLHIRESCVLADVSREQAPRGAES